MFWLLAAITVVYPTGYFFYYGNFLIVSGRKLYGPHYYLGLLIPATVLLGAGIVDLVRRHRAWLGLLIPLMIIGTVLEVGDKIDRNLGVRDDANREVAALDRTVTGPAVVIVPDSIDGPFVLHPRGGLGNPPDLNARRLYAADLLGRNNELFDRFPDRRIYRLQELDTKDGVRPDVTELHRITSNAVNPTFDAAPPDAGPADVGYVLFDQTTLSCPLDAAHAALTLRITPATLTVSGCADGDRVAPFPLGAFAVVAGIATGTTPAPWTAMTGPAIEAHYWIRNRGNLIDIIDPADLWTRPDNRHPFRVIDPATVPSARGL
jgi:hypothetical protein